MCRICQVSIIVGWLALNHLVCSKAMAQPSDTIRPRNSTIPPSANVQYELQARLIDAVPGDVIQLQEGRYELRRQLDIVTAGLTIRGAGSGKTTISFKGQDSGNAGLEATGDDLVLEGFAVEDTAGNAIKVLGADGVVFRDVRVEWTGPPSEKNGAYGLYPVQCKDVLIEHCTAIGASDAGIYVGQSQNVVLRNSRAERNVAGIEIENTIGADVYDNVATNNTGGILVFDLPGLQVTNGKNVRVFNNTVTNNNHPNFAPKGAIVSGVPPGTGMMIMATDDVEVFDNEVIDHCTSGVAILSFGASGRKLKDKTYDQFPEGTSIHDNRIRKSGYAPKGKIAELLRPETDGRFPDIFWDGIVNPTELKNGGPHPSQVPSILRNGEVTFANFNLPDFQPQKVRDGSYRVQRDLAAHAIPRRALPAVSLRTSPKPYSDAHSAVNVYRTAKRKLSEYGLFTGDLAKHQPATRVIPYDLNTPLFSDYTTKYRFIQLPEKSQIEFRSRGVFDFPDGTVIAKTFAYPHDMRAPDQGERLLETRIELKRTDSWYGFSYIWNEEQTDATLALGGAELEVDWIHTDGRRRTNHYQIPNANQCITCHQAGDQFVPLGPVAANMNRSFEFPAGTQNQLTYLEANEFINGLPNQDQIDVWPRHDVASTGTLDERARTWMHVNCAHCHNPTGTARPSGLDLRLTQTDPTKLGIWKTPVAAGHGTGGRSYDIVPGKPDESILQYRIESSDPSVTMPNVAKRLVPVEAAALIRKWISELNPDA